MVTFENVPLNFFYLVNYRPQINFENVSNRKSHVHSPYFEKGRYNISLLLSSSVIYMCILNLVKVSLTVFRLSSFNKFSLLSSKVKSQVKLLTATMSLSHEGRQMTATQTSLSEEAFIEKIDPFS